MSFIATADFQAEWNNLDRCQQAWDEVLGICEERKLKLIIVLGDLKQAMNPVDIRVIKWWQNAIRKASKLGYNVLVVLGNHDRTGQYSEADNWFSILRRAGAITYDKPGVYTTDEGRLFILPYCATSEAKRRANDLLREKPNKETDILLFHHDITGAKYNRQGSKSNAKLTMDDLNCSRYRYCLSGHIHMPQRIRGRAEVQNVLYESSVYYVGSPFCHDWGEVNQNKRYLVVGEDAIDSTHSRIPRWFDPRENGFVDTQPKVWNGARVRIRVSCSASEDYGRRLDRARKEAERKYKGAIIHVVPKFKDREQVNALITTNDTDEKKLRGYVQASRPTQLRSREIEKLISYMCDRIGRFGYGLRGTASGFTFKSAKAKNFLSFKEIKIDFKKKGIVVVQGINHDRGIRCSNGSGKTSFFQTLPVCLFGRTFKEQTHDNWANRWRPKEPAYSRVTGQVSKKNVTISRGRRPVYLRLTINGRDQSSGMKTNEKTGTQSLIEQVTGFTWSTLANSVYIDRSITNAFLSGTKKQRTEVLSRFQNLERFAKAQELVKQDAKSNEERTIQIRERLQSIKHSIAQSRMQLNDLRAIRDTNLRAAYKAYSKAKKRKIKWDKDYSKEYKKLLERSTSVEKDYNKVNKQVEKLEGDYVVVLSKLQSRKKEYDHWETLRKNKECPTCYQEVTSKWILRHSKSLSNKLKTLDKTRNELYKVLTKIRQEAQELDGKHGQVQTKIANLEKERNVLIAFVKTTESQYRELYSEQHSATAIVERMKQKIKEYKSKYRSLIHKKHKLKKQKMIYDYAYEAFSRDGIPAFLNRQLVPILNRASDHYSELFCDRDIQVKFAIEQGEFVPQVINSKGGQTIDDQSTGERSIAGLIASFALREVAPKTNVLFLDEPCEGVDEVYSRQFAKALKHMESRFCTIYLATHNVHILSELAGERTITVKKHHKISRII